MQTIIKTNLGIFHREPKRQKKPRKIFRLISWRFSCQVYYLPRLKPGHRFPLSLSLANLTRTPPSKRRNRKRSAHMQRRPRQTPPMRVTPPSHMRTRPGALGPADVDLLMADAWRRRGVDATLVVGCEATAHPSLCEVARAAARNCPSC